MCGARVFRLGPFEFKFKMGFFVLCLLFFMLFSLLGWWQVQRFHFKQKILSDYQKNFSQEPLPFEAISNPEQKPFLKVSIKGEYVTEESILIQKFINGKLGFEVITPFKLNKAERLMLIDRGWFEHSVMTNSENVRGEQQIVGRIALINEPHFILGKNILSDKPKLVMQKMDIPELSQKTGKKYYPFLLLLDPKEPHGFLREVKLTSVVPERHMAYAVQWFGLALVTLIGFICFSIERVK